MAEGRRPDRRERRTASAKATGTPSASSDAADEPSRSQLHGIRIEFVVGRLLPMQGAAMSNICTIIRAKPTGIAVYRSDRNLLIGVVCAHVSGA